MFRPFDIEVLNHLENWILKSKPEEMLLLSKILQEAEPDFVFREKSFVEFFLNSARQHGDDALKGAMTALYWSATTGLRSGTPGEPFPKDIQMKENATTALRETSRFSPVYELYQDIQQCAEQNINRTIGERIAFEDLDTQ